jgi:hypothetical protein
MMAAYFRTNTPRHAIALSFAALLMTAGCAATDEPLRSDLTSPASDVQACARWLTALDEAVDDADVRDSEAHQIPGFPYLRVNRFLASFRTQVQGDSADFAAWEDRLKDLDARTRGYELQDLPPQALSKLGVSTWNEAAARTNSCAGVMMKLDATDQTRRKDLIDRARVPDDYAEWKRVVGLYPLVRIPFFQFAKGWESDATKMFKASETGAGAPHGIVRYQPGGNAASARKVAAVLAGAKRDALGIPQLSDRDADVLFAAFAPVIEVETTGDYDRIGPLQWATSTREAPDVDITHPTIYRRLAFTRYGGQTLVQVVYLLWFSERPDDGWLDPLSGNLDGLFFRVTLDPAGRPLVYDTIHPCGCYHMFFPTSLATPIAAPDPRIEWAFVPRTLPAIELPQRVVIRVQSRSHYIVDIYPETNGMTAGVTYALADESQLRILPTPTGPRSIYGPDGIVRGTERGERFAVWPLGLEEAGSMREWGHHATALVGRRQFDDADLIERRFTLRQTVQGAAETRVSGQ